MKVFHARGMRGAAVGMLAASMLASVLGLAPSAHAAVFEPCNSHDLRDAVNAANALGGTDTIILNPKCKYTFTIGDVFGPDINAAMNVLDDLIVAGNGATIKISGNADLRHFTAAADLTLNNVTLSGGQIESPYAVGGDDLFAGSILQLAGDLRGDKLTVTDNEVQAIGADATAVGGGIVVTDGAGSATLVRSTVKHNEVSAYGLTAIGIGGGIYFDGAGDLTLTRSEVRSNEVNASSLVVSVGVGGGILDTGGLVMEEGSVSSNTVSTRGLIDMAAGGGIYLADGVHTMEEVKVSGNKVTADGPVSLAVGGGILNGGDLTDEESTISGNKATCKSSGFCLAAGGGYANQDLLSGPGVATFTETIFTGNKAEGKNGAGAGGGLAVAGGSTLLTEATVTKNEAKGQLRLGGGIANFGDVADVEIDASDVYKNKPTNCYNVPACEY
jgi:hypothetical protein